MSRQLHRCTSKIMGRQSIILQTLRTAAIVRPGLQRPISQVATTSCYDADYLLRSVNPAPPLPLDHYMRFQIHTNVGSRSACRLSSTSKKIVTHSVRWFSSDDKEGDDNDKKDEATQGKKEKEKADAEEALEKDAAKDAEKEDTPAIDKKDEAMQGKKAKAEEAPEKDAAKDAEKEDTPVNDKKDKKDETLQGKKDKENADAEEALEKAAAAKDAEKEDTPTAAAIPVPETTAEEDDCPPWMNPLHYKNPGSEKEFVEDLEPGEVLQVLEAPPLADANNPDKVLASPELYDLADDIVNLSMLEMKELVTKIGDHFEFEKPPFTGSDGSGGGGGDDEADGEIGEAEAAPAKTAFDVKLVSFDAKSKIKVIKEVRALAGLGLKEAKEMVEGAPKVVIKDVSKEAAEELQKKLEEVGAVVEIV